MGIVPGDVLLSMNDHVVEDIFDYRFFMQSEELTLLIRKEDGEEWELEIEKDEDEDLGIGFEEGLMDHYRSCSNNCIFCFIDQMPPGLRKTLYFKDDDTRLSFLQGNYVTLTNLKDADVERIIAYRLQPINISVHTTDPELRVKMLHNRFAGDALKRIRMLYDAGITMNGQIVLCRGINDGEQLVRTIRDLSEYLPYMQSLSVVPVGLTRYREGLYPLEPFTKEDAREVLRIVRQEQARCMEAWNSHFIHAGDEWYLLAEEELPEADSYDGYLQLENGVGMMRLLTDEFSEALSAEPADPSLMREVSLACGVAIAGLMETLAKAFTEKFPGARIHVYPVINEFFGERITVSGLLTGQDIVKQLRGKELGQELLLTGNLLKFGEDVLLDDMHVTEIEKALSVKIRIIGGSGADLLAGFTGTGGTGTDPEGDGPGAGNYEPRTETSLADRNLAAESRPGAASQE